MHLGMPTSIIRLTAWKSEIQASASKCTSAWSQRKPMLWVQGMASRFATCTRCKIVHDLQAPGWVACYAHFWAETELSICLFDKSSVYMYAALFFMAWHEVDQWLRLALWTGMFACSWRFFSQLHAYVHDAHQVMRNSIKQNVAFGRPVYWASGQACEVIPTLPWHHLYLHDPVCHLEMSFAGHRCSITSVDMLSQRG